MATSALDLFFFGTITNRFRPTFGRIVTRESETGEDWPVPGEVYAGTVNVPTTKTSCVVFQNTDGRPRLTTHKRRISERSNDAAVAALRSNPRVARIEPNRPVTIDGTQTPTPSCGLDRIDAVGG